MTIKFCFKSLFILLLTPSILYSQSILFTQVEGKDGKLEERIFDMVQDTNGYMWFGGAQGLSRYSGYRLSNATFPEGGYAPTVYGMELDHRGRLWGYSSVNELFHQTDTTFQRVDMSELSSKIPDYKDKYINNISIDRLDTVRLSLVHASSQIILSPDGEIRYNPAKSDGHVTFVVEEVNETLNYYKRLASNPSDSLIIEVNKKRLSVPISEGKGLSGSGYRVIKTRKGNYILATGKELIRFNEDTILAHTTLPAKINNALMEDSKGHLWVGLAGRLYRFENGILDSEHAMGLFDRMFIYKVLEDREGGIWVATGGAFLQYAPNPEIVQFTDTDFDDCTIVSFSADQDKVYIGTACPSVQVLENGRLQLLPFEISRDERFVKSLATTSDGTLWFSTTGGTYEVVNGEAVMRYPGYSTIIADNQDRIWSGRGKGLIEIDETGAIYNSVDQGFNYKVPHLYAGRGDTIWLSTRSAGLFSYAHDTIVPFERYDSQELPIHSIRGEEDGVPFFITSEPPWQLYRGGQLINIGEYRTALLKKEQPWYITQRDNVIWIATNTGLSRLDLDSTGLNCIGSKDYGLAEGILGKGYKGLFAGDSGLVTLNNQGLFVIPYDALKPNQIAPKVHLSQIKINTRDTAIQSSYELSYTQNLISFSFEGTSYKNPGNLDFKYKMSGVDKEWVISKSSTVQYTTLPPGDYTFEVFAANSDGVWSERPATISFTITPPYWQTWWFRIAGFLLLVGLIWGAVSYRFRNLQVQLSLREQSLEAQQKALRAQMTPHFMFNALNSIQLLVSDNDRIFAMTNISKFARLMRRVLHSSESAFIPLSEELESLSLYLELESLRFDGKFSFDIDTTSLTSPESWKIPPMLLQPFVENAIWHGIMKKSPQEGTVSLRFEEEGRDLTCTITDDGVGREKAASIKDLRIGGGSSSGIRIIRQRIETINRQYDTNITFTTTDLKDHKTNEAKGTSVTLVFANTPKSD